MTLKNRRAKIKTEDRLNKLESAMLAYATKEDLNTGMTKVESRLNVYIREQVGKLQETQASHKSYLEDTINSFEEKIHDYKK